MFKSSFWFWTDVLCSRRRMSPPPLVLTHTHTPATASVLPPGRPVVSRRVVLSPCRQIRAAPDLGKVQGGVVLYLHNLGREPRGRRDPGRRRRVVGGHQRQVQPGDVLHPRRAASTAVRSGRQRNEPAGLLPVRLHVSRRPFDPWLAERPR